MSAVEAAPFGGRARAVLWPPVSLAFAQRLRVRDGECHPQGAVFGASYLTYLDVLVDMRRRCKCPTPEAVRRCLEPYLRDAELEGVARGGAGTARDMSLAP